jgi:CRISPR-associated protein Cmr6
MPKGILKLSKTKKGKIIVALDRLNGKPPMPLSYVSFSDLTYNDKECEFETEKGKIISIKVDGVQIHPSVNFVPKPKQQERNRQGTSNRSQSRQGNFIDSFNKAETLLPKDVQDLPILDIDNFNLKFNKAARVLPSNKGKDKFYFFKNDYRRNRNGLESGHKFMIKPNYGNLNFQQISQRLENQAKTFPEYQKVEFNPDWRLILGMGSASIYEVGMTLHHIYGIPYIPASSIKGLIRSWIIQNCFGVEKDSEAKAFHESKLLCDIFGCGDSTSYGDDKPKKKLNTYYKIHEKKWGFSNKKGDVTFFDAFPTTAPNLEPDIMNVHYPDYYNDKQGKTAPTDFQSPNPIPFLTVGKKDLDGNNLKFITYIAVKHNKKISDLDPRYLEHGLSKTDMTLLGFVKGWLNEALENHGIGAKTAVGYGYMKNIN